MADATIYLVRCDFPVHYEKGSYSYSYKIGRSLDFKRRIAALRESCPFALQVIFKVSVPPNLARQCEKALHIRYKSSLIRFIMGNLANRTSKEWFVFNDALLQDVIAHMKEMKQGIAAGGWNEYVQREVRRSFGILRAS